MKLLFLADLKADYVEPFISDAPLSVEFFDCWWTVGEVSNLIKEENVHFNLDTGLDTQFIPTGRPLVDDTMRRWLTQPHPPRQFPDKSGRYRVWWQGDVIGAVEEASWNLPYLRGKWSESRGYSGKKFSKIVEDGVAYSVVVEPGPNLNGEMVRTGGEVTITLQMSGSEPAQLKNS